MHQNVDLGSSLVNQQQFAKRAVLDIIAKAIPRLCIQCWSDLVRLVLSVQVELKKHPIFSIILVILDIIVLQLLLHQLPVLQDHGANTRDLAT
jgi:hypothetical protein